ncbi:hypothetical protein EGW08_003821, partial [Elysia chlorotica]
MFLEDITFSIQEMNLAYKIERKSKKNSSFQVIIRNGRRWSEVYIYDSGVASVSSPFIDAPHVTSLLERAELIFISSRSFLLMNMDVTKLAYFTSSRFKTLGMQICDGIIKKGFEKQLLDVIKFIDMLFLSTESALKINKMFKLQKMFLHSCPWNTKRSIAHNLHKWIMSLSFKACTVIVYQGIKTAYVASGSTKTIVKRYRSKFYRSRNVIDLYGCENAFAGGYLSQYVQNLPVQTCINCAFFCASTMATQIGAHFPINRHEHMMTWYTEEQNDK